MSRLDGFELLVARARREQPPMPDVAAGVRLRLRALPPAGSVVLPVGLAAACAGAAFVVGYLGFQAWTTLAEPWLGSLLALSAWWML